MVIALCALCSPGPNVLLFGLATRLFCNNNNNYGAPRVFLKDFPIDFTSAGKNGSRAQLKLEQFFIGPLPERAALFLLFPLLLRFVIFTLAV